MAAMVFISHASVHKELAVALGRKLKGLGYQVWIDARELVGGQVLEAKIKQAIGAAAHFVILLGLETQNSRWVRKELRLAQKVDRKKAGYHVVPLLLPGMTPAALGGYFEKEPLAIKVSDKLQDLDQALPEILAAFEDRLPEYRQRQQEPVAAPLEDLILRLSEPQLALVDGKEHLSCRAELVYQPGDARPRVQSAAFTFTAPLGPIEADELRWYLEEFHIWPVGIFAERAAWIAAKLPGWGQDLYAALSNFPSACGPLEAWRRPANAAARRFSVEVDPRPLEGVAPEVQAATRTAATRLLALPWELLHDHSNWLFLGPRPAQVRRLLPVERERDRLILDPPIRVLLLAPRPEDGSVNYIDHRADALALAAAADELGDQIDVTVLSPPTFPALSAALKKGHYHVVHFDGHGVYDRQHGLGALCFEHPEDGGQRDRRRSDLVHADRFSAILSQHRVPLVVLDACQGGRSDQAPTGSVAAALLQAGVASVVAMSHSVLVSTSTIFTTAFYRGLAAGQRVGEAMRLGQEALFVNDRRGAIMGAGELRLQDWFVPVLYQEPHDPVLFKPLNDEAVRHLRSQDQQRRLGGTPAAPEHGFHGRDRELLTLERLLFDCGKPWVVVQGLGGTGKTALVAEAARYLVRSRRFQAAAWVSVEHLTDVNGVLDELGRQLLPEYSVAAFPSRDRAVQPVERALRERPTLIVLDNLESVLPVPGGERTNRGYPCEELFALCRRLLSAATTTRLVFTSREVLPAPFAAVGQHLELGALDRRAAIKLVEQVLREHGWQPKPVPGEADDPEALVESVRCHPRALVLLAREVARQGVRAATVDLQALMADLDRRHPGERENSLFASLELSLRRLAPEQRQRAEVLAVFHGGANLAVLREAFDFSDSDAEDLGRALVGVGLAEDLGHHHLRLDPALPAYLARSLSAERREDLTRRWIGGMYSLVQFLYQQRFQNTQLAANLTLLELPNLLAVLDAVPGVGSAEEVIALAGRIDQLLAPLGQPRALTRAVAKREQAATEVSGGHARFHNDRLAIERALQNGRLQEARQDAEDLLVWVQAQGKDAYPEAAYDLAMAHWVLGKALNAGGAAEAALGHYTMAQRGFEPLATAGNAHAARMVAVVMAEQADCLQNLGRLDKAVEIYEKTLARFGCLQDVRSQAVVRSQLGTVRLLQGHHAEALAALTQARETFERLGEPQSEATVWHQIGVINQRSCQYEAAKVAYMKSLAIRVRLGDHGGQADSLSQLGKLAFETGHLEETVTCCRQAIDQYLALGDTANEGKTQNNLADTLIKLGRHDEARAALRRAIECKGPLGHAAELWATWDSLHNLECASHNPAAAAEARSKAIAAYLAYRRDGGQNQSNSAIPRLCAACLAAIRDRNQAQADAELAALANQQVPSYLVPIISALRRILAGDRDPGLVQDPALVYTEAAELLLLLEQIAQPDAAVPPVAGAAARAATPTGNDSHAQLERLIPLIAAIAILAKNPAAAAMRPFIDQALDQAEAAGFRLAEPVRRILDQGERDSEVLMRDLDQQSSWLVRQLLEELRR